MPGLATNLPDVVTFDRARRFGVGLFLCSAKLKAMRFTALDTAAQSGKMTA